MTEMQGIVMYQMNCANCGEQVRSPHLAEVLVVECPECAKIVEVKNVVASNNKESIRKIPSLKNFLRSTKTNFQVKKYDNSNLMKKHITSERLSKHLIRDDFRLKISHDLYAQINFDNSKRLARLLNISYEGAGIELAERGELPDDSTETQLHLLLPGYEEVLSFPAKIVWTRNPSKETINPSITMGLQFREIDKKTHKCLCGFIWGSSN